MVTRLSSPRPQEATPAPLATEVPQQTETKASQDTSVAESEATKGSPTNSDNERPVREKFKKTSIAGMNGTGSYAAARSTHDVQSAGEPTDEIPADVSFQAKRDGSLFTKDEQLYAEPETSTLDVNTAQRENKSAEESSVEPQTPENPSREDLTAVDPTIAISPSSKSEIRRPERKRSRDQFDKDSDEHESAVETSVSDPSFPKAGKDDLGPEKKRHRDDVEEPGAATSTDTKVCV
jgi:hypothetical protein